MTTQHMKHRLDPLIHELPRLRICATLAATTAVESRVLEQTAGLSGSALSKHLKRLVEAGYARQQPGPPRGPGRPPTWVSLTDRGRVAYELHVAALLAMAQQNEIG